MSRAKYYKQIAVDHNRTCDPETRDLFEQLEKVAIKGETLLVIKGRIGSKAHDALEHEGFGVYIQYDFDAETFETLPNTERTEITF